MAEPDAPERPLPRRTGDLGELRRIQRELAAVRERDALVIVRSGQLRTSTSVVTGALAGLVVLVLVGVVARRVTGDDGSYELALLAVVTAVAASVTALLVRRDAPPRRWSREARARQHLGRLLARNAELWELLDPEPAADLPLPPDRQPVRWAGTRYRRYGRAAEPDPETALRALPADASAWRVRYHRHGGRGAVRLLRRGAVVLVVGGVALAVQRPF